MSSARNHAKRSRRGSRISAGAFAGSGRRAYVHQQSKYTGRGSAPFARLFRQMLDARKKKQEDTKDGGN